MKLSIKDMTLISLFAALTAIGAFISIPIGEVPITFQNLFVILSGLLLGSRLGALSQIVYLLLGLSGIRIFAGFSGGPQSIMSPSFGFIIGFIFSAYIVGRIANKNPFSFTRILFASLAGIFIIYLFGLPYMYLIINLVIGKPLSFILALKTGCIIFLPGDVFKAILSSWIGSRVLKRIVIEKTNS